MKKPKILQSFNPIKCKTSLRLAGSRLKLLRNKKEVQVKQMKREIAQLLESGQDQTARIRVEHVMREEKTMAAYDLLEIYCELIIARMPIIEFQKDCPVDLKEAIASIVFSSLRCGDVPELLDVRKQISAKYGKEFITAAIELHPMCGVGRLLVEKLSAAAHDEQSKIKILNAIAKEHNVKWESFEEKDSSEPTPIRKESPLHGETRRFEAAVQDAKISLGDEKLSSGQAEATPPGEKTSHLFQGDGHDSHLDSQKCNMEFKDAASAEQASVAAAELSNHGGISTTEPPESDVYSLKAEGLEGPPDLNSFAAAESAEQASVAAAELSNHGGISTTETPKSDVNSLKAEGREGPPDLNSFEKKIDEASANVSSSVHTEVDGREPDPTTSSRFEESGDDSLNHGSPFADDYIQKKEDSEGEMDMKKHTSIYETEAENVGEGNFENEPHEPDALFVNKSDLEVEGHGLTYDEQDLEEFNLAQKSLSDSWSPTSSSSNVVKPTPPSLDVSENPTLRDDDDDDKFAPLTVDDSSDEDMNGHNVVKSTPPFVSSTKNSTLRDDDDDDDDDNFEPLTFGDSSDEDMHGLYETGNESVGSPSRIQQHSEIDSSLGSEDSHMESKEEDISNGSRLNFGKLTGGLRHKGHNHFPPPLTFGDSSDEDMNGHYEAGNESVGSPSRIQQHSEIDSSLGSEDSQVESKEEDISNESRLNFGKLTGGLRHKRHNHFPPVFKNNASTATTITSSTTVSLVEQPTIVTMQHKKNSSGKSHLISDSDSDDTCEEEEEEDEEILQQEIKLNLGASYSQFYSNDSDLDEDFPKVSHSKKSRLQSGISRRTKASSSSSGSVRSDVLDSNGTSETPEANETSSGKSQNREQPISVVASVKTNSGKASYNTDSNGISKTPEANETSSGKSENCKQPIHVVAASVKTKPEKAMQEPKISKPEKKASHVHPKLPDYDALVQSLRINTP